MSTLSDNNKSEIDSHEESPERFDIQLLHDSLCKCCEENNTLHMEHYLIAFKEMYRFFSLLGSVFGFVASDIISKLSILEDYKKSDTHVHYSSIQSMIDYESSNGICSNTSKPSGSRTLLRLHRSLEFIMAFMRDFSIAEADAKSSSIAQKCYTETLSKHHPWLIRKGANLAMYTLPARQQFLERIYGGPCDSETVHFYSKLMGNIAAVSQKVYDETQRLYEVNGLLDLP